MAGRRCPSFRPQHRHGRECAGASDDTSLRGLPVLLGRCQLFLRRSLDLHPDKAPRKSKDGHGEPEPSALPSLVPRQIDVAHPPCKDPDVNRVIRLMKGGGGMAVICDDPVLFLQTDPMALPSQRHGSMHCRKWSGQCQPVVLVVAALVRFTRIPPALRDPKEHQLQRVSAFPLGERCTTAARCDAIKFV